jgi:hypothetical protein
VVFWVLDGSPLPPLLKKRQVLAVATTASTVLRLPCVFVVAEMQFMILDLPILHDSKQVATIYARKLARVRPQSGVVTNRVEKIDDPLPHRVYLPRPFERARN